MIGLQITSATNVRVAEHNALANTISLEIETQDWTGNCASVFLYVRGLPPNVVDKLLSAFCDDDTLVSEALEGAA